MSQPAAPVTVRRGAPSKPGTVVDTKKATVVPPSPEVRIAEDAARSKAKTDAVIGNAVAKMTGKKPVAKKSTGNGSGPVARLTDVWTGKDGKDVAVKDRVRTAEGIVIDVIGRWTRKAKAGNVPMVTGHIVSLPAGMKDRKKGDRQNAIAAGCTHVKP
jgi:hypothetical protein